MEAKGKVVSSILVALVVAALCVASYFLGTKRATDPARGSAGAMGADSEFSAVIDIPPVEPSVSKADIEDMPSVGIGVDIGGKREDIEAEQRERLMRNLSENLAMPGMNQIIREQQRVLMADKYRDLIQTLGLNDKEKEYLLNLLTARQMLQIDMGMKLMTGMLSEAERAEMMERVGSGMKDVDKEIDWFLNNGTDSDYFRYYDKTEGERATVTSVANVLNQEGHPFDAGVEKELVAIMYEELTSYPFSVNFEEDGEPVFKNFTADNINTFLQELAGLRAPVVQQASSILDPDQLEVFAKYYDQYVVFYAQRLQMARQFFGPNQ